MRSSRSKYARVAARVAALAAGLALALAFALVGPPATHAAMVQKMNLQTLCDSAGTIVRAEVASVEEATVALPGGEIPTRVYTLRVREALKGISPAEGRTGTITLTMVDPSRFGGQKSAGTLQHVAVLPDLPILETGSEYLLLTTEASTGGLSTTVGLAQGLFRITAGPGGIERVANGLDNVGLLDGMAVPKSIRTSALTYGQITTLIRGAVAESR
jgi:hypothetical protein